jgi:phosphate-selective porin OprO/OprP
MGAELVSPPKPITIPVLSGCWLSGRASQIVNQAGALATISASGWQATGSFALTGDVASYTGLTPRRPITEAGGSGAVEVLARVGQLKVDNEAFPIYADPTRSARTASEWAVGVNWHLERRIKLAANYIRTTFDGGGATGDREAENAILTRFQVAF